jgi:hypothetical protein
MTNENVDLEKIKDRVAKLLRMADDASSPNEAAIAAGRARALMDKYQIEAFDAHAQVKDEFSVQAGSVYFNELPTYMSTFGVAVAQYNDCQARYEWAPTYSADQGKKRIMFMGYKQDVDLAIAMFKRLLKVVDRLSREYLKAKGHTTPQPRLSVQFKYGAVTEINSRIRMMTVERDAITSSGGTSLVIAKKNDVEAEYGKVKYSQSRGVVASGAAEAEAQRVGRVRGAEVEINPSVRG